MGSTIRTPLLLILILVLTIAIVALNYGTTWFNQSSTEPEFDLVEEAWEVIVSDYVDSDKIDLDELSRGAIEGMLEVLNDPYSAYFDAELYELSQYNLEGTFGGIGVEATINSEGHLIVIAPIVGTPAYELGLMPGDRIMAIEGESTENTSLIEAVLKIRGEPGTDVKLSILHVGEEVPEDLVITREEIEITSVLPKIFADSIAHIEISHFSTRTGEELKSALKDVLTEDVNGIILDIRNNPGGVLKSAITVTSQFIEEGVIAYVIYGDGSEEPFEAEGGGLATELPLAVLVNGNSASASEIVAGAIQDYDRGVIIGTQTIGKGAVNHFRQLSDGSAIYITSARWFTPDKRQIDEQGIVPDEIIEISEEDIEQGNDPQLEQAVSYIENLI